MQKVIQKQDSYCSVLAWMVKQSVKSASDVMYVYCIGQSGRGVQYMQYTPHGQYSTVYAVHSSCTVQYSTCSTLLMYSTVQYMQYTPHVQYSTVHAVHSSHRVQYSTCSTLLMYSTVQYIQYTPHVLRFLFLSRDFLNTSWGLKTWVELSLPSRGKSSAPMKYSQMSTHSVK